MDWMQVVGVAASVCTGAGLVPQLIKMIKEKKAEQVSPVMVLVLLAGNVLWIVYGIMKEDWIIIISNGFSTGINIALIIMRQIYCGKNNSSGEECDGDEQAFPRKHLQAA